MLTYLTKHPVWTVVFLIVIAVSLAVVSRPTFRQKPDTVVIRWPGRRLLGPPQPALPEAILDLDYALLRGCLRRCD
jgi:hypothetical protein